MVKIKNSVAYRRAFKLAVLSGVAEQINKSIPIPIYIAIPGKIFFGKGQILENGDILLSGGRKFNNMIFKIIINFMIMDLYPLRIQTFIFKRRNKQYNDLVNFVMDNRDHFSENIKYYSTIGSGIADDLDIKWSQTAKFKINGWIKFNKTINIICYTDNPRWVWINIKFPKKQIQDIDKWLVFQKLRIVK